MRCKKCGHRANTIGAMAKHYRKAHPGAMKTRVRKAKVARNTGGNGSFCPHCGYKL